VQAISRDLKQEGQCKGFLSAFYTVEGFVQVCVRRNRSRINGGSIVTSCDVCELKFLLPYLDLSGTQNT
jgi:hypothetical protein